MARRKTPTLPTGQQMCRGLFGHGWQPYTVDKLAGGKMLVRIQCSRCDKMASILLSRTGEQLRPRAYVNPENWVVDPELNTAEGKQRLRAQIAKQLLGDLGNVYQLHSHSA